MIGCEDREKRVKITWFFSWATIYREWEHWMGTLFLFVFFQEGVTFGHVEFEVPGRHLRSFSHPVHMYNVAWWNRRELWWLGITYLLAKWCWTRHILFLTFIVLVCKNMYSMNLYWSPAICALCKEGSTDKIVFTLEEFREEDK